MSSSGEVTARCEAERHGGWRARVAGLDCEAHAKRLDQLRDKIALEVHEHTGTDLCDVVIRLEGLFPDAMERFEAAQAQMSEANRLRDHAAQEIRAVVASLRDEHLTMRDISALLGISPQRVAQLAPLHESPAGTQRSTHTWLAVKASPRPRQESNLRPKD